MANRLDNQTRDILRFRPIIEFIEPEPEIETPNPVPVVPDQVTPEDLQARREKIRKTSDALDLLATAIQALVDQKSKDIKIRLDPIVDAAAIAAMRRQFPDEVNDDTIGDIFITYDQYKKCRDAIRDHGCAKGAEIAPTQDEIGAAKQDFLSGKSEVGGIGTLRARNGGLRPELYQKGKIIEPLDLDKFQNILIKILINYIWKHFIRPQFAPIGIPGVGDIGDFLPKRLAKLPKGFKLPDLIPKL